MSEDSSHPDTILGCVHLTVADLDRSLGFYQDILGFKFHRREGTTAHLGAGGDDVLALSELKGARQARGTSGLYHFAVLVPSRFELARSLRRLAETRWPLQGFADHRVSEAIYLADPDGNGIEIYRDRPRPEWPRRNGAPQMATDPLDVDDLLDESKAETEAGPGLHPAASFGTCTCT